VGQLHQRGLLAEGARIVIVSSESHRTAEVDLDTFGDYRPYGVGEAVREYGQTKLLLCTFAHGLARVLRESSSSATVHALCPGAVRTSIAREAPRWTKPLLFAVFSMFFRSPEKAREPVVYLSAASELAGRTGIYLHLMEEKAMARAATDARAFDRLLLRTHDLLSRVVPEEQLEFFDLWTGKRGR
jgi:NAD(P)-dependent dehydrogenase (short-subunit alcohol dehydrogenase family)